MYTRPTDRDEPGTDVHARDAAAQWMLALDDFGGNGFEHDHDRFGHAWPMTRAELETLRAQIDAALAESA